MRLFLYVSRAVRLTDWRALRLTKQSCPLCNFPYLIKLGNSEHAVRCLRCGASPAAMSLGWVLKRFVPDLEDKSVYELSSRGSLFRFLRTHAAQFTFSEYFDDVPPGGFKAGVQCQDVQQLTFPDCSFDVCTSTDVFEHVPDDTAGFSEIYRVLRPGGWTIFTVPLHRASRTIERARLTGGHLEHLLTPEYHDDHIRGLQQILAYRNYGTDVVEKLLSVGFSHAEIVSADARRWWGYSRDVVVASR